MKYTLIILILSFSCLASKDIFEPITYGDVSLGDHRIKLNINDFIISKNLKNKLKVEATLIKNSIQWVRVGGVLLKPRARIKIKIKGPAGRYHFGYENQNILLHQNGKFAEAEFFISLFQPEDVIVYQYDKLIGNIIVHPKTIIGKKRKTHVIDYSCFRYKVEIIGLDNEFISVGCKDQPVGKMGSENTMLEVYWTSADYSLLDHAKAPYLATFTNNDPVELTVVNRWGKIKKIKIRAKVPKRFHRLKTAIGLGPYAYYTQEDGAESPSEIVPAVMFYAKFDLNKKNSLRLFDALLYKESLFNNFGVYHANDVAKILDKKITITTLLGFQGMSFKFSSDSELFNQFIFPQGIEINYMHAFGIDGFLVNYGMFLSPDSNVKYNNIWIRWGKRYFWEINYIDWGFEDRYAKTWGLSIGIPFKQFF